MISAAHGDDFGGAAMISAAHGGSAMISAATAAHGGAAMPLRRSARPGVRCNAGGGGGNAEDSGLKEYYQERDARIRRGLVGKTMSPDSLASLVVQREEREAAKAEEEEREAVKAKERSELIKYSILTVMLYGCTKTVKEPHQTMLQLLILLFAWIITKQKVEGSRSSSSNRVAEE